VIKNGTESRTIERMFATGVSPLVMSDVTSGFNMGMNISDNPKFAQMVGFNDTEVEQITDYYIENGIIPFTRPGDWFSQQ
jgi:hypothetical protein